MLIKGFQIATVGIVLAMLTISASSASQEKSIDGEYVHRFRQCEGTLNPVNCVTSEEGIKIERRNSNSFFLYARTRSGSIFHSCEYVAVAYWRENGLVAGDKQFCEVTVSFQNGAAFLDSDGDGCRTFCSAQASLRASNLIKKHVVKIK